MTSRLVLRQLFEDCAPEEHGQFVPLHPGVDILPLYGITLEGRPLSPHGPSAAFIRYAPGARVPRHGHPGFEHIIVLRGSQSDSLGVYPRGTCVVNPPGSSHSVASEEGCLVLAIWDRPVELLPD
ncbi:MAG TPA: cupin domain-containing protein [Polyangiaceae bacterium]|nr:cupin domain-containing protein [Polyangiaceae bacterium]